jgi:ABC-type polysaccharide/polyol phosphate export permease
MAASDLAAGMKRWPLATKLGWQDVRQRYRRSALGPFWLTISMGIMIGTMGAVFGQLFETSLDNYLPFLTAGIILWGFISAVVSDGCLGFISAEAVIKQLPIPLFVHILRLIWRNVLILCHNIVIFPIVSILFGRSLTISALEALPGASLLIANLCWIALILAIISARYRDLPQVVASVLQVFFYLTPIMWMPSTLSTESARYMLGFNPAYHLVEIVRAPLLGQVPTMLNWGVSIGLLVVGWTGAAILFGRYKARVAYWL